MGWSADGWGKYIAFHAVQDLALCLPASHQRYNPTMITSFCVTAGHAGELIPSNEFCSPAVPWDEKENCVYLGAAFHHGLASLVLLYATHTFLQSHKSIYLCLQIFSLFQLCMADPLLSSVAAEAEQSLVQTWTCLHSTQHIAVLWLVCKNWCAFERGRFFAKSPSENFPSWGGSLQ